MGRRNKVYAKDLHQQAYEKLTGMFEEGFGQSKKEARVDGTDKNKIFTSNTYNTYWKHIKYFIAWLKVEHPTCTTIKAARKYVNEWLQMRTDQVDAKGQHLSAWTIQTEAASLNKLYQIDKSDQGRFIPPKRNRADIKRSRGDALRDKHFSAKNNDELIKFCRGTGCRRNVLERLEGRDYWPRERMEQELWSIEKRVEAGEKLSRKWEAHASCLRDALRTFPNENDFVHHRKDKNGRYRFAPIIGAYKGDIIERFGKTKEREKVWLYVSSNADIHGYRSDYATDLYKQNARRIEDIPYDRINRGTGRRFQSAVYVCRKDEAGKRLDKQAMLICSKALGHNRLSVVADNYLRGL